MNCPFIRIAAGRGLVRSQLAKPRSGEGVSRNASEPDSASLHFREWPTCQRWRSLPSTTKQRTRAVVGLSGVIGDGAC